MTDISELFPIQYSQITGRPLNLIHKFEGEYRFLSNFYLSNVYDSFITKMLFPSVENAYQASKSLDPDFWKLLTIVTPGKAKRLGKSIKLRDDWEEIKLKVMANLLKEKFKPGSILATKLIDTFDAVLVEGNTWNDKIWGKVLLPDGTLGEGKNYLGQLLMGIRKEILRVEDLPF